MYTIPKVTKSLMKNESLVTSGVAHYKINTKHWDKGTYKLCVIYWGSDNGDYPRADKEITLHIT